MTQIRYFVHQIEQGWRVRRDTRDLGAFEVEDEATAAATEQAAIDRVRGHHVEVLKLGQDGRWAHCARFR